MVEKLPISQWMANIHVLQCLEHCPVQVINHKITKHHIQHNVFKYLLLLDGKKSQYLPMIQLLYLLAKGTASMFSNATCSSNYELSSYRDNSLVIVQMSLIFFILFPTSSMDLAIGSGTFEGFSTLFRSASCSKLRYG